MGIVAVVTPIYATPENGRLELFRYTLKSVLRQCPDVVHVVVDDGSQEDVEYFLREHGNSSVRYLKRERQASDLKTASNALNLGIDNCIAKNSDVLSSRETRDLAAVTFLHSDDVLTRDSIEKRLLGLKDGFVFTEMAFSDKNGLVYCVRNGLEYLQDKTYVSRNPVPFNKHTLMWNTQFLRYLKEYSERRYEQFGVFDSHLFFGEDLDVVLSSFEAAIEGNFEIDYLPFASVIYRNHPNSISGETHRAAIEEQSNIISIKHFGQPGKLSKNPLHGRFWRDFPWTIGASLPEPIKARIRPIRNLVQHVRFHMSNPQLCRTLEECMR